MAYAVFRCHSSVIQIDLSFLWGQFMVVHGIGAVLPTYQFGQTAQKSQTQL